jgi:predicted nucleotidyltransferase
MTMPAGTLPPAETRYLRALTEQVQRVLGAPLVGVYLFGSAAYGAYQPGRSDLDVQAVVAATPACAERRALARRLAHARLPCPARRLELVVYARAAIAPATRHPQFLLNLNTGADVAADRLALDPADEASHWFLLDIAMGRELGRALLGPPAHRVFAPIPRRWCLEALLDSLAWHAAHEVASANSVRNACRGWRYAATATFGSKQAGARWALHQPDCPPAIAPALREEATTVAAPVARDFLRFVAGKVHAALAAAQAHG